MQSQKESDENVEKDRTRHVAGCDRGCRRRRVWKQQQQFVVYSLEHHRGLE